MFRRRRLNNDNQTTPFSMEPMHVSVSVGPVSSVLGKLTPPGKAVDLQRSYRAPPEL